MAQVLYITANPKSIESSVGVGHRIGQAFLKSYRETHANDEITEINVYEEDFPILDGDILSAWEKIRGGIPFTEMSQIEKQKIDALNQFIDRVASADKYVFVSPMWNWSIPPRLKAFIDSIVVVGKTFHYTEKVLWDI